MTKFSVVRNFIIFLQLGGLSFSTNLNATESMDSIYYFNEERHFQASQLILPVSLTAIGTLGVYNGAFHRVNNSIKKEMESIRGNKFIHADDYIQYIPITAYLGLGSIGITPKHSLKERIVVGATAHLIMVTIINTTKYTIKEKRPDSDARNSFPSGHTATVFTGAELIREEYGTGLGITAYTVATGVAFLRLYNSRHWLNDVITGAGVGILSARIGYWMLPLYQQLFHWKKNISQSTIVALPSYNYNEKFFSVNMVVTF